MCRSGSLAQPYKVDVTPQIDRRAADETVAPPVTSSSQHPPARATPCRGIVPPDMFLRCHPVAIVGWGSANGTAGRLRGLCWRSQLRPRVRGGAPCARTSPFRGVASRCPGGQRCTSEHRCASSLNPGSSFVTVMTYRELLRRPESGLSAAGFTVRRSVWTKEINQDLLWRFVLHQDPDQRPYIGQLAAGVLIPGVVDLIPNRIPDSSTPGVISTDLPLTPRPRSEFMGAFIDVRRAGRRWWGRPPADPQSAAQELVRSMVSEGLAWLAPYTTVGPVLAVLEAGCRPRKGWPLPWDAFLELAAVQWKLGDAAAARATVDEGRRLQPDSERMRFSRQANRVLRLLEERYPT